MTAPRSSAQLSRPIVVLSGALGSGKTSGITQLLARMGYRRPHVIVNDIGISTNEFDASGLPTRSGYTTIGEGCACCDKRAELLTVLCDLTNRPQDSFDSILLEVSGVADPANVVNAIVEHPKLRHHLVVDSLVHYIDALDENCDTSGNRSALALANICVVSKADLVGQAKLASVQTEIRATNPTLAVLMQRWARGHLTIEQVHAGKAHSGTFVTENKHSAHARPVVQNLVLPMDVSWLALTTWMAALLHTWGDRILRIKASVPTAEGVVAIHGVKHTVLPPTLIVTPPGLPRPEVGTMVLIGERFDPALVLESITKLVHPRITIADSSDRGPVTERQPRP